MWRLTPKASSVAVMTLASALHYSGYEFARSSVLALFTSRRGGFASSTAAPLATGCISPFSLVLLWFYSHLLEQGGSRHALRTSSLVCATIMAVGGLLLGFLDPLLDESVVHQKLSCALVFCLLVSQNGFVQLLSMQHWSFMSSVQTELEGAVWFAPIAGVASVASTLAAMAVSPLVDTVGLQGLLLVASTLVICSALCGDYAHSIAKHHGFEPEKARVKGTAARVSSQEESLFIKAKALFGRVPVLGMLCREVVLCQCFSSLVSFLFVLQVKEAIPSDVDRARWTGNCYAWINGLSGCLQFLVLPVLTKRVNPRIFWLLMPSSMLAFTAFLSCQLTATLHLIGGCFCTMKIMEYTLRSMANEMVYVSLDYESRFMGKEIIGLCANRLGKSGMAVTLSVVTAWHGGSSGLDQQIAMASNAISIVWLLSSYRLTSHLQGIDSLKQD